MKERIQTENNQCSRNNKFKNFGKINYLQIYSVKKGREYKYENWGTIGEFNRKGKNWNNYKKLLC